jgi:hypothetical protein
MKRGIVGSVLQANSTAMSVEGLRDVSGGGGASSRPAPAPEKPFPFTKLPPELRDRVAGHVADNARGQFKQGNLYGHDIQSASDATRGAKNQSYYESFHGARQRMWDRTD